MKNKQQASTQGPGTHTDHSIRAALPHTDAPSNPSRKRFVVLVMALVVFGVTGTVVWYFSHHHTNPIKHNVSSHNPSVAPAANGWLHTDGTKLVDASGNNTLLVGVDDSSLDPGQGNTSDRCHLLWTAASPANIAAMRSMGFNTVRIGVSWANLEPTAPTLDASGALIHHWNTQYLAALDGEITAIQDDHMMAIIDMHQAGWSPAFSDSQSLCEGHGLPSWLYTADQTAKNAVATAQCEFFTDTSESAVPEKPQEGLAAAWSMLASRYTATPAVIGADMFNEPNWPKTCSGADLAAFYERIGNAIRISNKNIVLMYEDNAFSSYNREGFLLKRKPALTNAVYSWHFYPLTWQAGMPSLQAHFARAQSWNIPLWIGEFDGFGGSYNTHVKRPLDPNWQTDLAALMSYFKQNNISWSIWEYDGGGYSVVTPGTNQPKTELISILHQGML